MKKIIIFIVVVAIFVGGYFIFQMFSSHSYIDKKYGFQFGDTTFWQKTSSRDNSYLTFVSNLSNGLKSYVYINLQPRDITSQKYANQYMVKDYTLELTDLCQNTAKEKSLNFNNIEKLNLANTNSYKCNYETTNSAGDKIIMEQWIIQKIETTIMITDLYSDQNQEEKGRVARLLDSFSTLDN